MKHEVEKRCEYCGKTFYVKPYRTKTARFCSRSCTRNGCPEIQIAQRKAMLGRRPPNFNQYILECIQCGKHFKVSPSRITHVKYCSHSCYWEHVSVGINSYKTKSVNGIMVLVHRYVMEMAIGRKLMATEIVHHINGDRSDNRIENLRLVEWGRHSSDHMCLGEPKIIGKVQ